MTNWTKRIVVAAVLLAGLSACGDDADDTPPRSTSNGHRLYVETIDHDGQDYTCVVYDDDHYEQGGVWCERKDPE
jgi:hypothetical protein